MENQQLPPNPAPKSKNWLWVGFLILFILLGAYLIFKGLRSSSCNPCDTSTWGFEGYYLFSKPVKLYLEPYDILSKQSPPPICMVVCSRFKYQLEYGLFGFILIFSSLLYLLFRIRKLSK